MRPVLVRRTRYSTVENTRSIMLINRDDRRLLLELSYSASGTLRDVSWQWVELTGIPKTELEKLEEYAESLRKARERLLENRYFLCSAVT